MVECQAKRGQDDLSFQPVPFPKPSLAKRPLQVWKSLQILEAELGGGEALVGEAAQQGTMRQTETPLQSSPFPQGNWHLSSGDHRVPPTHTNGDPRLIRQPCLCS